MTSHHLEGVFDFDVRGILRTMILGHLQVICGQCDFRVAGDASTKIMVSMAFVIERGSMHLVSVTTLRILLA